MITITHDRETAGVMSYVGVCDECLSIKSFGTSRERDLWELYHPHQEHP